MINIQQAAKQMIVLPPDFSYIGEIDKALISFSNDDNNKKISMTSEIQVGQGDLIKDYPDDILLYANEPPAEIP